MYSRSNFAICMDIKKTINDAMVTSFSKIYKLNGNDIFKMTKNNFDESKCCLKWFQGDQMHTEVHMFIITFCKINLIVPTQQHYLHFVHSQSHQSYEYIEPRSH